MLIQCRILQGHWKIHFNTSHVNVNQHPQNILTKHFSYFNTSHVNVNPVDFAIIKAGGADDGLYEDREFENSYNKLESAGIHKGAYFFGNALSVDEAVNEARYFAQLLACKSFWN